MGKLLELLVVVVIAIIVLFLAAVYNEKFIREKANDAAKIWRFESVCLGGVTYWYKYDMLSVRFNRDGTVVFCEEEGRDDL